jgi:hypothetical protein
MIKVGLPGPAAMGSTPMRIVITPGVDLGEMEIF